MIGPMPVMILPYSTNEYAYAKKYTIFGMLISDSFLLQAQLFIYLFNSNIFIIFTLKKHVQQKKDTYLCWNHRVRVPHTIH